MKSFTTDSYGRTIIIHLGKGEKILESLTAELKRLDVRYGMLVSAIGSLRKACLHVITNTEDISVNKYILAPRRDSSLTANLIFISTSLSRTAYMPVT